MKTTISTLMTFSVLGLVATPAGALTAPRSSHDQQAGPTTERPASKSTREPEALFDSTSSVTTKLTLTQ
jgi:hypothetical protein